MVHSVGIGSTPHYGQVVAPLEKHYLTRLRFGYDSLRMHLIETLSIDPAAATLTPAEEQGARTLNLEEQCHGVTPQQKRARLLAEKQELLRQEVPYRIGQTAAYVLRSRDTLVRVLPSVEKSSAVHKAIDAVLAETTPENLKTLIDRVDDCIRTHFRGTVEEVSSIAGLQLEASFQTILNGDPAYINTIYFQRNDLLDGLESKASAVRRNYEDCLQSVSMLPVQADVERENDRIKELITEFNKRAVGIHPSVFKALCNRAMALCEERRIPYTTPFDALFADVRVFAQTVTEVKEKIGQLATNKGFRGITVLENTDMGEIAADLESCYPMSSKANGGAGGSAASSSASASASPVSRPATDPVAFTRKWAEELIDMLKQLSSAGIEEETITQALKEKLKSAGGCDPKLIARLSGVTPEEAQAIVMQYIFKSREAAVVAPVAPRVETISVDFSIEGLPSGERTLELRGTGPGMSWDKGICFKAANGRVKANLPVGTYPCKIVDVTGGEARWEKLPGNGNRSARDFDYVDLIKVLF